LFVIVPWIFPAAAAAGAAGAAASRAGSTSASVATRRMSLDRMLRTLLKAVHRDNGAVRAKRRPAIV
jgi:hypothetical protein